MEYLLALLMTVALYLPNLTGQAVPNVESLPAIEAADQLEQAVFAHTGQSRSGGLTTAAYLPQENVIFVTSALLDDLPELEAAIVHELVHWWQVRSRRANLHGGQAWEGEARAYENLWRREHNLRLRRWQGPANRRRP